jgi:7,8-dihydropterin-6-yl-methyl-4-(beta-D-ribofuranosyl)aminobenzene 5'-phosphate synthase
VTISLVPVDQVQIITLEDNYVDLLSMDNTGVVTRAMPIKGTEFSNSVLAEHGFSCLVRTREGDKIRSLIFDFGLSPDVAARNSEALSLNLSEAEAAVLSHGHIDHFGGIGGVGKKIGKQGVPLFMHPGVFKKARYVEPFPGFKITMPVLQKEEVSKAGFSPVLSSAPASLLAGRVAFLGQIPKNTPYEKGMPNAFYETDDGQYIHDPLEDDSAIAMLVRGKGLVILSGCAHAGIVNTVKYGREVTGQNKVHAVVGGFHLAGQHFADAVDPTIRDMKDMDLDYIVPTHCTGRSSIMAFERACPDKFVLNMSGSTLTF